ncbi:hypothetical protein SXCC_04356 [Gluconacetobacter sp. SXCC-1]|nr:hypothetical protein SXCC_04356 [Gluconacetobacter sp. SXCC-1]
MRPVRCVLTGQAAIALIADILPHCCIARSRYQGAWRAQSAHT